MSNDSIPDRAVILKTERKCNFCKKKENNKLKYGPLYEFNRIVAHYFCVLLSTKMKQNGKDNEGIMGFLYDDINLELRRSRNSSCVYCWEKHATVKCNVQSCKRVFHYPCGIEAGALSRFRNDFVSYCFQHRPKSRVPKRILDEAVTTEQICAICYETVDVKHKINTLWAPCCRRTWYHRECIQIFAQSSGYFFRCATCNDTATFKTYMEDNGIFVPQEDASWEQVPNAYEELLVRHSRCDADHCKCPRGRERNVAETRWEIILCRYCGSQGIHVGCGKLKFSDPQWECSTCQRIMETDSSSSATGNGQPLVEDRTSSPAREQPGTAEQRKRKMSEPPEGTEQNKKERIDEEASSADEETNNQPSRPNSSDEFSIRIPEFVYADIDNDKPHTVTRPNNENEDVDVVSVGSAWLMVEEVLSRVKPAPLCHKLKVLRNKVFAFHFDPFDIREEIEVIDLVSDSEDDIDDDNDDGVDGDDELNSDLDEGGNIEISNEMSEGENREVEQEFDEAEGLDSEDLNSRSHSSVSWDGADEGDLVSFIEPEVIDITDDDDDDILGVPEAVQHCAVMESEMDPSAGTFDVGESEPAATSNAGVAPQASTSENTERIGPESTVGQQSQAQESSDDDEDEAMEESVPRQPGKKFPGKGVKYSYEVKRPRLAAEAQGPGFNPNVPSTSWQGSAPRSPSGQILGNLTNAVRPLNCTTYRLGQATPSILISSGPVYIYNSPGGPVHGTTAITCQPSPSGGIIITHYAAQMPVSGASTSGMPLPGASTSGMPLPGASTSGMPLPGASTSAMPLPGASTSAMPLSGASTSGMSLPGASTSAVPLPGPSTSAMPLSGASTSAMPLPGASTSAMSLSGPSTSAMPLTAASTSGMSLPFPSTSQIPMPRASTSAIPFPFPPTPQLPMSVASTSALPFPFPPIPPMPLSVAPTSVMPFPFPPTPQMPMPRASTSVMPFPFPPAPQLPMSRASTSGLSMSFPTASQMLASADSTSKMEVCQPSTSAAATTSTTGAAAPGSNFRFLNPLQANTSARSSYVPRPLRRTYRRRIFTALDSSSSSVDSDVNLGESDSEKRTS